MEAVFIATERRKQYLPAVIMKSVASAAFVALGVLGMRMAADKGFAQWIVAAALLLTWLLRQIEVEGAIKVFGIIYIGVIVLMTAVATGLFLRAPQSKGLLLFMIGAYLFTASDLVLALNQFGKRKTRSVRSIFRCIMPASF